jgi:hypothetical protein
MSHIQIVGKYLYSDFCTFYLGKMVRSINTNLPNSWIFKTKTVSNLLNISKTIQLISLNKDFIFLKKGYKLGPFGLNF